MPTRSEVVSLPHDPVGPPRDDMRRSGFDRVRASGAGIRLHRRGCRLRLHVPHPVTPALRAQPSRERPLQVERLRILAAAVRSRHALSLQRLLVGQTIRSSTGMSDPDCDEVENRPHDGADHRSDGCRGVHPRRQREPQCERGSPPNGRGEEVTRQCGQYLPHSERRQKMCPRGDKAECRSPDRESQHERIERLGIAEHHEDADNPADRRSGSPQERNPDYLRCQRCREAAAGLPDERSRHPTCSRSRPQRLPSPGALVTCRSSASNAWFDMTFCPGSPRLARRRPGSDSHPGMERTSPMNSWLSRGRVRGASGSDPTFMPPPFPGRRLTMRSRTTVADAKADPPERILERRARNASPPSPTFGIYYPCYVGH